MKDASTDMADFTHQHQDLECSLPSDTVTKWRTEVEAWEADPGKPNPFEHVTISTYIVHAISES